MFGSVVEKNCRFKIWNFLRFQIVVLKGQTAMLKAELRFYKTLSVFLEITFSLMALYNYYFFQQHVFKLLNQMETNS